MKNKYLKLAKTVGVASLCMIAAGAGASELAKLCTDNGMTIGVVSTATQFAAYSATFLPLYARDNRDIYKPSGKFKWGNFIWDNLKLTLGFLGLDIAYGAGRPFTQRYFLDSGMGPTTSSLISDMIGISAYVLAAIPLAKVTRIFNGKNNLEKMIDERASAAARGNGR